MDQKTKRLAGVLIFTLLYPATAFLVQYIPNPMLQKEGSFLALNMSFIVMAGYFYGPLSGAFAGAVGTGISALLRADWFDAAAVLPHMLMGLAAGWAGGKRSPLLGSFSIVVGHSLNMLFYLQLGMIEIPASEVSVTLLGLATETMINVVGIMLVIVLFKKWLYHSHRW